ncbi:penicillin-binding protein 1C [Salipiger sp. 1_MG-2023]|uniref:penicillin-binding protein 1C n=1 Tax=Salipiger sp. 1_MG-2023 TaxID=3062665 RepID=UPI0026E27051|nr:penicillin-binding protein 1C [Salipiger sp. 1_MG-2023]MDO6584106.1 penicillin-binding protein 1C [Salipiger sp. 1_MG-2023]
MARLFVLVALLWGAGFARDRADDWIARTDLPVLVHATSPEIRDRDGAMLRAYTVENGLWRMAISADAIDPALTKMLIAYEDRRFLSHGGVDPWAALRAGWQVVVSGGVVSGASTLTMQVARLLEDGPTGNWQGKLRQARVALALERRLSKAQILQLYMELAPYGGNIEGLRAASLTWLGKEPRRLTPAEAALLVALPQSPETRRPDRHPEQARAARNRVLARMARAGVLDSDTAQVAMRAALPGARRAMPMLAPHLADRALAQGVRRVTLDGELQQRLETLARAYMTGRDARLSVALLVADHQSGELLASVGSGGYASGRGQGFVDMSHALRSPGSTLKPLVYGLAFDRGLAHPETLIADTPVMFAGYAPQNFDGVFRGELRVARALQLSLNIPVVRLTEAMGPAHLMAAMRAAGMDPQLPGGRAGLAVSLGGVGVTSLEMLRLYAALAQGGEARPLRWDMEAAATAPQRILSRRAAWQVGHVLAGLAPPAASGPPGQVAWKTGTSYGHRDAWALGWDGRYVVAVWIGRPDGTPVPGAFGGDLAAPLLFEALGRVRPKPVPLPAPPPETLLVSNADLPVNLRRFGGETRAAPLEVIFPPSGARLLQDGVGIALKLRGGQPPFTVLADGEVVATQQRGPLLTVPPRGPGFTTLSVIDAAGRTGRVSIELR